MFKGGKEMITLDEWASIKILWEKGHAIKKISDKDLLMKMFKPQR